MTRRTRAPGSSTLSGTTSAWISPAAMRCSVRSPCSGSAAGCRYLAAVRRGPEVARVLCQHGFPHHAADAATLRAAQECLEGGGLTGSLARLLADQVEDLRRSAGLRSAS
ncbi:MAG TPA: hypothetical protein VHN16_06315 [Streptosporangiaceae bacterium]|nr:hypothetical protein [Streptosporangiaceae bacterium]